MDDAQKNQLVDATKEEKDGVHLVEAVVDFRVRGPENYQFRIKWAGFDEKKNSWVSLSALRKANVALVNFWFNLNQHNQREITRLRGRVEQLISKVIELQAAPKSTSSPMPASRSLVVLNVAGAAESRAAKVAAKKKNAEIMEICNSDPAPTAWRKKRVRKPKASIANINKIKKTSVTGILKTKKTNAVTQVKRGRPKKDAAVEEIQVTKPEFLVCTKGCGMMIKNNKNQRRKHAKLCEKRIFNFKTDKEGNVSVEPV